MAASVLWQPTGPPQHSPKGQQLGRPKGESRVALGATPQHLQNSPKKRGGTLAAQGIKSGVALRATPTTQAPNSNPMHHLRRRQRPKGMALCAKPHHLQTSMRTHWPQPTKHVQCQDALLGERDSQRRFGRPPVRAYYRLKRLNDAKRQRQTNSTAHRRNDSTTQWASATTTQRPVMAILQRQHATSDSATRAHCIPAV